MKLCIALLVETPEQQEILERLIEDCGYKVACNVLAEEFEKEPRYVVADAWLININLGDGCYPHIESWLERLEQPLVFEDQQVMPKRNMRTLWLKRISRKLHQLEGNINLDRHPQGAAKFVWVLGASTGGPKALKEFFSAIEKPLDVGFIYVQHLNDGHENTLIEMINNNSPCRAFKAKHGAILAANTVAIIANETWVDVLPNGTLTVSADRKWPGDYSPSISQVFANVARSFAGQFGVILFTGMGADGVDSLKIVRQQGGRVLAQESSSCTIASMPELAVATGTVEAVATPKGLATIVANNVNTHLDRIK